MAAAYGPWRSRLIVRMLRWAASHVATDSAARVASTSTTRRRSRSPGPVIDAHDPQGVGAAGHCPGALFQDAQDRVVTHRHAETAQEPFASAASECVADHVDDVTQADACDAHVVRTPREVVP